jgi:hypothetical protein
MRFVNKNTEFFSTADPDTLINELIAYFEEKGHQIDVSKDKYKIKVNILIEGEEPITMAIKILKAAPEKFCVEFTRTGGEQLQFFNQYKVISESFADLADTTY